jgi:hypothetical protein
VIQPVPAVAARVPINDIILGYSRTKYAIKNVGLFLAIARNWRESESRSKKFIETHVNTKDQTFCVALATGLTRNREFLKAPRKPSRPSARLGVLSGEALRGA